MTIHSAYGCEIHLPTSGGQAGYGRNRTRSYQVRRNSVIVKNFRFKAGDIDRQGKALEKAKQYIKTRFDHPQLIFVQHRDGDALVRCPNCQHEGRLMASFSLLAAGFNGIKKGAPNDLDLQECGQCNTKLLWDNVPED